MHTSASTFLHNASEPNVSCGEEDGSIVLKDMDVVCGRTRLAHNHPGNRRYHAMIHACRVQYQCAPTREDKAPIVHTLLGTLKAGGARFVKFDEQTKQWQLLDDQAQYDKVSHALRSAKQCKSRASQFSIQSFPAQRSKSDSAITGLRSEEPDNATRLFERQQGIFQSMKIKKDPAEDSSNSCSTGTTKTTNLVFQMSCSSSVVDERPQQFWFEAEMSPLRGGAVLNTPSPLNLKDAAAAAAQALLSVEFQQNDPQEESATEIMVKEEEDAPLSVSSLSTFCEEDVQFLEDWCCFREE